MWLIFWLAFYRERSENPRVNEAENALIDADSSGPREEEGPRTPWRELFKHRYTWGLVLGYFCQVYILYVFVTWLPDYLVSERHLSLLKAGFYGMLPFIFGAIGAFLGGWLSDVWVRRNPSGRKLAMSLGMVLAIFIIPAAFVSSSTLALLFLTICEFGVMFSNGSAWAACSEMAPQGRAASLAGTQNFGGNVGAFLAPSVTGLLVQVTNSFISALVVAELLAVAGALLYYILRPARPLRGDAAPRVGMVERPAHPTP